MVSRERRVERGRQRGVRLSTDVGQAFRRARRSAGLSQATVARMVGTSQPTLSRIECGVGTGDLVLMATIGGVVGLDLVTNAYPGASPLRDAGHIALTRRLQLLLPADFTWQTERFLPIPRDQRSIDAVIVRPPLSTGFEVESRLTDAQALVRRASHKQRDAHLACMVLVFADTAANRRAVAAAEPTLRPSFPLGARQLLAALRAGRTPEGNGILFA